ncbi:MAG: flagellar export chaperone FliS [Lachnospiraceae bacterium]|nr:flagellar export chaperone FliS [Lachnospiraceae bacterium]
MAMPNAFAQYNNNKIMTASPAELTLMLYEGAIKYCNIAIDAAEQKNVMKAHSNIVKVENIIAYLRNTLDMKYAVAKEYDRMYDYLQRRLFQANMKKDAEILKEVNTHLRSIRDTWKEVMRINRGKGNL